MKEKRHREIRDLMLAAFLLAKKYPLVSYKEEPNGFVSFMFMDSNGSMEKDIKTHLSGKAKVNSTAFVAAYRNLRSIIIRSKGERRNGKNN